MSSNSPVFVAGVHEGLARGEERAQQLCRPRKRPLPRFWPVITRPLTSKPSSNLTTDVSITPTKPSSSDHGISQRSGSPLVNTRL